MQNYIFVEKQPLVIPKNYFHLANGQIVKSIAELPEIIERIDPSIFNSHVSPYKNDFAKWVYDVYENEQLSKILGSIKSQEETVRILRAYLKQKNKDENQKEGIKKEKADTRDIYTENIYSNNNPNKTEIPGKPGSNLIIKTAQEQVAIEIQKNPEQPVHQQEEKQTVYASPIMAVSQQQAQPMQPRKIYTWKTQESSVWVAKGQKKQEEQKSQQDASGKENGMPNKPIEAPLVEKHEVKKAENIEIKEAQQKIVSQEIRTQPIQPTMPEVSSLKELNGTSLESISPTVADEYFIKNPVTMGQLIDSKKKTLTINPLEMINYSDRDTPTFLVEQFKDIYSKAYQRMVYLRKSGFDTSLVELMIQRIPSKIKIFDSSKELKDAVIIKRYLNETIEELNNVK